jgi:hypothetical protein
MLWIINGTQNALLYLAWCPCHLSDDASTIQSVSPAHRCNLTSGASLHASIVFARLFYNEVDSTPRCTCHVPRRDGCPRADCSVTATPRHLTGATSRPAWSQHTGDERYRRRRLGCLSGLFNFAVSCGPQWHDTWRPSCMKIFEKQNSTKRRGASVL